MRLGIKPKLTLDLLILNISKGVYVCLAVDVYTDDQHKRLIHKLQAKEKNYDLLPMKCLERIRSAPIKSKREANNSGDFYLPKMRRALCANFAPKEREGHKLTCLLTFDGKNSVSIFASICPQ